MPLDRLFQIAPLALALAACSGGGSKPPAAPAPSAQPTATIAAPARPGPAKPATAQALAPLMGTWAADLTACGTAATISVSASQFTGAENRCAIASFGDNGDGTFTATTNCTAEGRTATERIRMDPVFAPTGEGITLTYLDRGNEEVTVLRCDAAPAASQ